MSNTIAANNDLIEQCGTLLEQNRILDCLEEELRKLGYSGSTNISKLIYLCLNSRFSEKPSSAVIKGPSGSGKSFALSSALKFVPPSAYEEVHGMSDKALMYMKDMNLKQKHLVIQEAAGMSEGLGRVFLRQLLSEGEAKYLTVQKTSEGMKGEELSLKGPTGVLMTTTANSLHHEDETRMLSLHVEQSPEQIRKTLLEQALGTQRTATEVNFVPWHALHEFVGSNWRPVVIPYAKVLAERLPNSDFRVTRDFPQLLTLLRTHALMHQINRDTDSNGQVIANSDDYAVVYGLIHEQLAQGLDRAVPPHIRKLVETVKEMLGHCREGRERGFAPLDDLPSSLNVSQLATKLQMNQGNVTRNLLQAISLGFLENLNPGQGRTARIILGSCELPNGTALPSPDELVAAILQGE
jgi:hypothetical protein